MNIFILDKDPKVAARLQCDKHVVKMIVESAQMLSTAHRMLDGVETHRMSKSGKTMTKYWELPDARESVLYKAVHMGHPCTVWTMICDNNYMWHYDHFSELCREYTYRYGKQHKSHTVLLEKIPYDIDLPSIGLTPFPQAMPDEYKGNDPVMAYRKYYINEKADICTWKNREVPSWFW